MQTKTPNIMIWDGHYHFYVGKKANKNNDYLMTSADEEKLHQEIRAVYNSGDSKLALEMACVFFERYPRSHLARYCYAVMHGDYSFSPNHIQSEKLRLLDIAKIGISNLLHDPFFNSWPRRFRLALLPTSAADS